MYSVYIIRSLKSQKYYTGVTSNLEQRIHKHNHHSTKSTKNYNDWKLVYKEDFEDKKSAWKREKQIKKYKGGEAFKKLVNRPGGFA